MGVKHKDAILAVFDEEVMFPLTAKEVRQAEAASAHICHAAPIPSYVKSLTFPNHQDVPVFCNIKVISYGDVSGAEVNQI